MALSIPITAYSPFNYKFYTGTINAKDPGGMLYGYIQGTSIQFSGNNLNQAQTDFRNKVDNLIKSKTNAKR